MNKSKPDYDYIAKNIVKLFEHGIISCKETLDVVFQSYGIDYDYFTDFREKIEDRLGDI